MKRLLAVVILFCVLLLAVRVLVKGFYPMPSRTKTITLAIPNKWGPLTPAQQSTYAAAIVLANVFESLVQFDPQGNIQPALARAWEISPDMRVIRFMIDTSRQFSNGLHVSAALIKQSFENSLHVSPAGANRSALDLLYQIEGYEEFEAKGTLPGIEAHGEDTLVLKFKQPFRQALSFLAGVRYSVYYVAKEGNYLGTGPYCILDENSDRVSLKVNDYWQPQPAFLSAQIVYLDYPEWETALCRQQYDVFWILSPSKLPACVTEKKTDLLLESGAVTRHQAVNVNGSPGRIFADNHMRRAIQYLIVRHAVPQLRDILDHERVTFDPQFFLPLQPGRLAEQDVDSLIDEGKRWVPTLVARSKMQPVQFTPSGKVSDIIIKALREDGINIVVGDRWVDDETFFRTYYKTQEFDLLCWGATVSGMDPDAIYHYLGQAGAISTPAIGRARVWESLETGRQIIDASELDRAYQEVSRAILEEVPAVHFAFHRGGFLYSARVRPQFASINSHRISLNYFVDRRHEERR